MTTIAIKDGVMACDSQVSAGHSRTMFQFPKVILHNDVYYGFAGYLSVTSVILNNIVF